MKEVINLAIAQFEDLYDEWGDYRIRLVGDNVISVFDNDNEDPYLIEESKEILTDFKSILKHNALMISSHGKTTAKIDAYTYGFEPHYEHLADKIEKELGAKITNLVVTERNKQPFVRFEYAGNITSGEKAQIRKKIEQIVEEHNLLHE